MNRNRAFLSFLIIAALGAAAAHAAEPASGLVGKGKQTATWMGGPYTAGIPNQLGCVGPADPTCDGFALTVDLKPGSRFAVGIASEIEGDDYDLYVFYPDGTE